MLIVINVNELVRPLLESYRSILAEEKYLHSSNNKIQVPPCPPNLTKNQKKKWKQRYLKKCAKLAKLQEENEEILNTLKIIDDEEKKYVIKINLFIKSFFFFLITIILKL